MKFIQQDKGNICVCTRLHTSMCRIKTSQRERSTLEVENVASIKPKFWVCRQMIHSPLLNACPHFCVFTSLVVSKTALRHSVTSHLHLSRSGGLSTDMSPCICTSLPKHAGSPEVSRHHTHCVSWCLEALRSEYTSTSLALQKQKPFLPQGFTENRPVFNHNYLN